MEDIETVIWVENTASNRKRDMLTPSYIGGDEYLYVKDSFFGTCVVVYEYENRYEYDKGIGGKAVFRYYKQSEDSRIGREGIVLNPTHYYRLRRSGGGYPIPNYIRLDMYDLRSLNALTVRYGLSYHYYMMRSLSRGEYKYPNEYEFEVRQVKLLDILPVMVSYLREVNMTQDEFMQLYVLNHSSLEEFEKEVEWRSSWFTEQPRESCMLLHWLDNITYMLKDGRSKVSHMRESLSKLG